MINLKRFPEKQHRSGWNAVQNHLSKYHSEDSPLILDDFLDSTFMRRVHPGYTSPWIGFIHCTPHSIPPYPLSLSATSLIECTGFQNSMPYCKGIYTLSEHLATHVRPMLPNTPVEVLYHPTGQDVPKFNYALYRSNPKLLQIGYWMREFETFPLLNVSQKKYALTSNHIIESVRKHIEERKPHHPSVAYLDYVDNNEYDEWLTNSVVFLNYIDLSASNAIIECIARTTPMLINRHPAAMEYLGKDYPMYYSSRYEAEHKISDNKLIILTQLYLQSPEIQNRISFNNFDRMLNASKIAQSGSIDLL